MLKSYSAEISGTQLKWIDAPPKNLSRQPVLVVIEESRTSTTTDESVLANVTKPYDFSDLLGRLAWRGDAVAVQRGQRDAW